MTNKKDVKRMKENSRVFPSFENIKYQSIDDRIGITSDKHFGSLYHDRQRLNEVYDAFNAAGIKQVYDAGDLTDGFKVYPGQIFDQDRFGLEDQATDVISNHPRLKKQGKQYLTGGNHDASYLGGHGNGADILKRITDSRKDLIEDGYYFTRYLDKEMGTDIIVEHPSTGGFMTKSYGLEKFFRLHDPEMYPDILIHGHRHSNSNIQTKGCHAMEAGCFMKNNAWATRRHLSSNRGGWIVDLDRKDGEIKKISKTWIGSNKK